MPSAAVRQARRQGWLLVPSVEFPELEPRKARLLPGSRALLHPEASLFRRGQRERNRLRRMAHRNRRSQILQQLISRPTSSLQLISTGCRGKRHLFLLVKVFSVVQDDVEQRAMHLKSAVVMNKSHLAEAIHKKTYARPGSGPTQVDPLVALRQE